MKLFEFKLLDDSEQIDVVYNSGVYIGKRREERWIVLLYQVDSFYVELYYKKYRHRVIALKSSASTNILDPYLAQIAVVDLV